MNNREDSLSRLNFIFKARTVEISRYIANFIVLVNAIISAVVDN